MEFSEKLFQALKKDDLKEFRNCMETNPCGSLRLGRFPLLSVLYLYNSKRILRAYEKSFLRHNSWQDIGEPVELAAKFRSVAGKCLRLYLNETVSPAEMLLILDNNGKLKRVFPETNITAPAKQRLKNIYYVRWGLEADFKGGNIQLQRRPLKRVEKLHWFYFALCIMLCVVLIITPFVVNVFRPFIKDREGVLNVSEWWHINFSSDKIYALKNDVVVSEDFFVEEMNCKLRGNGHKVVVSGGTLFGCVNGSLTDIVFETKGYAVAEEFSLFGVAENVTVNATVDRQTDKACAFFVNNNCGTLLFVTVNVSGKLTAVAAEAEGAANSFKAGGIVATNKPTIYENIQYSSVVKNCAVNFDNFTLQGNLSADASFGGIVGQNNTIVEKCSASGNIFADTFDVAGICSENNYRILESKNQANISQHADVTGWNPLVAGIVVSNHNTVKQCENTGNLVCNYNGAISESAGIPTAYAAGIAYQNAGSGIATPVLEDCANRGSVSVVTANIPASAAGVCNFSNGATRTCQNYGKVSASGDIVVDAAGIVNLAYGYIYRSANFGELVATGSKEVRVGGIAGTSCVQISECFSSGTIDVEGEICYVGGIVGYCSVYSEESSAHYYCGSLGKCVSDCKINVTEKFSLASICAVGGVVGFVQELEVVVPETGVAIHIDGDNFIYTDAGLVIYADGYVRNNYFTGKLQTTANSYVGATMGVAGKNVYLACAESSATNFCNNAYVDGCGARGAFGAALTDAENVQIFETVADVGALAGTLQQIEADETYRSIINAAKNPYL